MEKKVVIITGASRGIGLAIAERLTKSEYKVYGLCRSADNMKGKMKDICWLACDVTDLNSVQQTFDRIKKQENHIDVLINNAGMGISGAIEFSKEYDIKKQMDVNLKGAMICTQQVLGAMRKQGYGKVIFISSLGAIFPLPYQSFYSVSKAGMNVFSDALRLETAQFGIDTCAVMLNDVKTEFTAYRQKNIVGNDIYNGRIEASVAKMEKSEQSGMAPKKIAVYVQKLIEKKHMPPHSIVGAGNKVLVLLYHLLPTRIMLKVLGWIYG